MKRVLSFILVLVMLVTMLPMQALAELSEAASEPETQEETHQASAQEEPPVETSPKETAPPPTTQPAATEAPDPEEQPEQTQPASSEPEEEPVPAATQPAPEETQPETPQPEQTQEDPQPVETEPEAIDPEEAQPEEAQPEETEPEETEPVETEPEETEPEETEPEETDPEETEPEETEPEILLITYLAPLPEEIGEQLFFPGAAEEEIVFPAALTGVVNGETMPIPVAWELCTDPEIFEYAEFFPEFDGTAPGSAYLYLPTLPEEYTLAEDVTLPEILVAILSDEPMTLEAEPSNLVASGTCGMEGDNLTWTLDEAGTLTISGTGEMTYYSYYSAPWYSKRTYIQAVVIEPGVTGIGSSAFEDCSSLTSVTIPDSVTSIGFFPFSGCYKLKALYLTDIAAWCRVKFANEASSPLYSSLCDNTSLYLNGELVTTLEIPDGVTSFGDGAFFRCTSLTSVLFPDSVTSIGNSTFELCSNLTSVTIPDGVTSIGDDVFCGCEALTGVTIPENVTTIGKNAFSYCTALTGVTIPGSVTSIGEGAFSHCTSLTSANIPEGVTSIEYGTFDGCSSLTSITIPESATRIDSSAFCHCSSLTSVTIPDSVTSIGGIAFFDCDSLTSVTIPGSVTSIGDGAFGGCDGLTSVTILEGVTSIGDHAFEYCYSLPSVTIPGSVTSIGDSAFRGCSALTEVTIPGSVTSIGDYAFQRCSSLASVTILGSVTSIGGYAFYNCTSLTSVTILGSATSIGGYIGGYAFSQCSKLTSVTIPDSVTSIGDGAFSGCSSLSWIEIPFGVEAVGESAFSGISEDALFVVETGSWFADYAETNGLNYIERSSLMETVAVMLPQGAELTDLTLILENARQTLRLPMDGQEVYILEDVWKTEESVLRIENAYGDCLYASDPFLAGETTELELPALTGAWAVELTLLDGAGAPVAGGYTLTWLREDGTVYSADRQLRYVPDGKRLIPAVQLSSTLGRRYRDPDCGAVEAGPDSGAVQISLEPFRLQSLAGTVTDEDGAPIPGASVLLRQRLNGRFEETAAGSTDKNGGFAVSAWDEPGELTVVAPGYRSQTVALDKLPEGWGEEPIVLSPAESISIRLEVTCRTNEGQTLTPEALSRFTFTVSDGETAYTDYALSGSLLIVYAQPEEGAALTVTAEDPREEYAPGTAQVTAELTAALELVQRGCIEAQWPESQGRALRLMVFDGAGQLRYTAVPGAQTVHRTEPLPDGSYTLLLLEEHSFLTYPASLGEFGELGFAPERDYAQGSAEVTAGAVARWEAPAAPELNLERFLYTDPDVTDFYPAKEEETVGNRVTVYARTRLKSEYQERATDYRWIITYPVEGCDYAAGTVSVGGLAATSVEREPGRISVRVADPGELLRLRLMPLETGTHRIGAYLEFLLDGERVLQPVGSFALTGRGLTLSVPENTVHIDNTACGTAPAGSTVYLYDNEHLVGQTEANYTGSWQLPFALYKPYASSEHQIYARVVLPSGKTVRTETSRMYYSYTPEDVQVSKVTMYNLCADFGSSCYQNEIVFDFVNPDASTRGSYNFYPGKYPTFSFTIEFTECDLTKLSDVKLVAKLSDGSSVTTGAEYSEAKGCFVASVNLGSSAPVSVSVEFSYQDQTNYYSSEELEELIASRNTDSALPERETEVDYRREFESEFEKLDIAYFRSLGVLEESELQELQAYNDAVDARAEILRGLEGSKEEIISALENADALDDCARSLISKVEGDESTFIISGDIGEIRISMSDWDGTPPQNTANPDSITTAQSIESGSQIFVEDNNSSNSGPNMNIYVPSDAPTGGNSGTSSGTQYTIESSINYEAIEQAGAILDDIRSVEQCVLSIEVDTELKKLEEVETALENRVKSAEEVVKKAVKKAPDSIGTLIEKAKLEFAQDDLDCYRRNSSLGKVRGLNRGLTGLGAFMDVKDIFEGISELGKLRGDTSAYANEMRCRRVGQVLLGAAGLISLAVTGPFAIGAALTLTGLGIINNRMISDLEKRHEQSGAAGKMNLSGQYYGTPKTPIVDPSGYIYEAVASNRLMDVTVTCEEQVTRYDDYDEPYTVVEEWDAAAYDQQNPMQTTADGAYAWDVPDGLWRVRAEKAGYRTTYSQWLPVPPPQLDINLGLVSMARPEIKSVYADANGVEVEFTRYLKANTVTAEHLRFLLNGTEAAGTLELMNLEANPQDGSKLYVSRVRFQPEQPLPVGETVCVQVTSGLVSYANVAAASASREAPIQAVLDGIELSGDARVELNTAGTLKIAATPASAAAGKWIVIESACDTTFLSLEQNRLQLDENGCASIRFLGELPGQEVLTVTVEGTKTAGAWDVEIVLKNPCEHLYQYTVDTFPTAEEAGAVTFTCLACGDSVTLPMPALGEEGYAYAVVQEPDCTNPGQGEYSWAASLGTVCIEVELPPLGHQFEHYQVKKSGSAYKETAACERPGCDGVDVRTVSGKLALSKVYNSEPGIVLRWAAVSGAAQYRVFRRLSGGKWAAIGDTSDTEYLDTTAKPGKTYEYRIRCLGVNGVAYTSDYSSAKKLLRIGHVVTTVSNGSTGVSVKWNPVSGVTGYYVYRQTGSGSFKKIATVKGTTKSSYTDKTAASGTTYVYRVRAYKSSTMSSYQDASILRLGNVAPKASNLETGIRLQWTAVKGAEGYYVYRKLGSTSEQLAVVEDGSTVTYLDTEMADSSGESCTYTVKAYSGETVGSGTGIAVIRLGHVETAVTNVSTGIAVSWNPVEGATGYEIYRRTGSGSFKKLATVKGATKSSYTDKTAASGTVYTYRVKAYKGGAVSSYTNAEILRLAHLTPTAANTANGITLKWKAVTGAEGYEICRKTGDGDYEVLANAAGKSTVSYTDATAEPGVCCSYTVKAVKADTVGTCTAVTAVRLAAPTVTGAENTAKGTLTVTWEADAEASGYELSYKVGSTAKTVTVKDGTTVTKAISKLTKGKTYEVKLRSWKVVDGKTYYSAWSAAQKATVKK